MHWVGPNVIVFEQILDNLLSFFVIASWNVHLINKKVSDRSKTEFLFQAV